MRSRAPAALHAPRAHRDEALSADPTLTRARGRTTRRRRSAAASVAPAIARIRSSWHRRCWATTRRPSRKEDPMPVKHALLALLAERDLTGYEVKLRFERVLGEFWQLNSGQVYSTLERLRRRGLASQRLDGRRRRPRAATRPRAAYSLRPRGRQQLEHGWRRRSPRLRPVRDPLYVKLAFSAPERSPALLATFAGEARRYGEATRDAARARRARADVARRPGAVARRRSGAAELRGAARVDRMRAAAILGASAPPATRPRHGAARARSVEPRAATRHDAGATRRSPR